MQLNDKQREIIENSMWIVNTILEKNNLSKDEDLRQTAVLYMCKCLLRFDESKNVKWSTYAYKSLLLYIRRVYARQKIQQGRIVSQDIFDIATLVDEIECADSEEYYINDILNNYDNKERAVLEFKLNGFKGKEIRQETNMSMREFRQCMASIGEKYKEIIKG